MNRLLSLSVFAAVITLAAPVLSHAATAQDCSLATALQATSINSVGLTDGNELMVDVRTSLGAWTGFPGMPNPNMCLLSTGDASNVTLGQDYDHPGTGADTAVGDRVEVTWELVVPAGAYSLVIRSNFFSREYPEWVGDSYNDTFEINVIGSAFSGQAAFDSFGNPVTVNSALFAVTDPVDLVGTGFDQDGATGWIVTTVPVNPSSTIAVSMSIEDVADGVWDSAVLLHGFEWSASIVPLPFTVPADEDGNPVEQPPTNSPDAATATSVSPSLVPWDGGIELVVTGENFDDEMSVRLGAANVAYTLIDDSALRIPQAPPADAAGANSNGTVNLRILSAGGITVLDPAITYEEEGEYQPLLDAVFPGVVTANQEANLRVQGRNLGGATWSAIRDGNGRFIGLGTAETSPTGDGDVVEVNLVVPPLDPGYYELRAISEDGKTGRISFQAAEPPEPDEDEPTACNQGAATSGMWGLALMLGIIARRRIGGGCR